MPGGCGVSQIWDTVGEQCPCDHTGRLCSLEAHPQSPKNVIFDAKLRPHFVCADSFQISGNKKKRGSRNSLALLTTPVIIAAVVVSFSDSLPGSISAVPHRTIPRFALQSDNPASLFLFFVLAVSALFLV